VDRIAQILEIAAREPSGATLTEIASRLEAPVSSIQSLINGLVAASFLDERDKRFMLGPTPYVLNLIAGRTPVRTLRHADIELLSDLTERTIVLGIAVGSRVVYIDHIERGNTPVAFAATTHVLRPLLRTSTGRCLLAFSDRRDVFSYLRSVGPDEQPYVDGFIHEMDEIRASGMAISAGYMLPERYAVAVPVIEDGRLVAAVAAVGLKDEMEDKLEVTGQILRRQLLAWSKQGAR